MVKILMLFACVISAPTVVQNVHVALAASDQVVVKWLPPDPPHGVITNYEVEYWSGYSDRGPVKISGDQLSYKMTHLQANMSYGIRVRAYTKVGEGPYSEIVYAFTEESSKLQTWQAFAPNLIRFLLVLNLFQKSSYFLSLKEIFNLYYIHESTKFYSFEFC